MCFQACGNIRLYADLSYVWWFWAVVVLVILTVSPARDDGSPCLYMLSLYKLYNSKPTLYGGFFGFSYGSTLWHDLCRVKCKSLSAYERSMHRLRKALALVSILGALGIFYLGWLAPSESDAPNPSLATMTSSSTVFAEPAADSAPDNSAALLAEALRKIDTQEKDKREEFLEEEKLVRVRDALKEALRSQDLLGHLSNDHVYWLTKRLSVVSWDLAVHGFTAEQFSGEEGADLLQDIFHNRSPEAFAVASELVVVGSVVRVYNALDPRPALIQEEDIPSPLPPQPVGELDGFRSTIVVQVEEVLKGPRKTRLAPGTRVYIRQRSGLTQDGALITVSTDFDAKETDQYVFFLSNVMYRYAVHAPGHPVEAVDPVYKPRNDLYLERHSAHLLNPKDPEGNQSVISGIRERLGQIIM